MRALSSKISECSTRSSPATRNSWKAANPTWLPVAERSPTGPWWRPRNAAEDRDEVACATMWVTVAARSGTAARSARLAGSSASRPGSHWTPDRSSRPRRSRREDRPPRSLCHELQRLGLVPLSASTRQREWFGRVRDVRARQSAGRCAQDDELRGRCRRYRAPSHRQGRPGARGRIRPWPQGRSRRPVLNRARETSSPRALRKRTGGRPSLKAIQASLAVVAGCQVPSTCLVSAVWAVCGSAPPKGGPVGTTDRRLEPFQQRDRARRGAVTVSQPPAAVGLDDDRHEIIAALQLNEHHAGGWCRALRCKSRPKESRPDHGHGLLRPADSIAQPDGHRSVAPRRSHHFLGGGRRSSGHGGSRQVRAPPSGFGGGAPCWALAGVLGTG